MTIIENDRRDINMSNPFSSKEFIKKAGTLFDFKRSLKDAEGGGKALVEALSNLSNNIASFRKIFSAEGLKNKYTEGINALKENASSLGKQVTNDAWDTGAAILGSVTGTLKNKALESFKTNVLPGLDKNKWRIGGGAAAAAGLYGGYKGLKYYLKRRAANLAHQRAMQLAEAPTKNIVQQIRGLGGNLQTSADAINAQLQNISNSINGRQFGRDLVLGAGEGLGQLGSQAYDMAKNKLNQIGQGINNYRINTVNPFVSQHKNALIGAGAATGLGLGGYGLYNRFNSEN